MVKTNYLPQLLATLVSGSLQYGYNILITVFVLIFCLLLYV